MNFSGDANNNSKSNDKGCRICKEEGHFARECPKKGEDRPKRGCFKCGEEGHSKADCPNEAKDGGGDKRGCFKVFILANFHLILQFGCVEFRIFF